MRVVGLDLSGPRNFADTCLVVLEERGENLQLTDVREGADDQQILNKVFGLAASEPIVIGIDAPLSYQASGGDRPSDSALRRLVKARGGRVGVMPPTMTRMVYLTLRGLQVTRLLEGLPPELALRIVEVHPGAAMLLRGAEAADVRQFKSDAAAGMRLLAWLEAQGLRDLSPAGVVSEHYVAACAAALAAWQWHLGQPAWCFAATPPHHPYDFAC